MWAHIFGKGGERFEEAREAARAAGKSEAEAKAAGEAAFNDHVNECKKVVNAVHAPLRVLAGLLDG